MGQWSSIFMHANYQVKLTSWRPPRTGIISHDRVLRLQSLNRIGRRIWVISFLMHI